MPKRKCSTPKCRGNALTGERFCFACRRVQLKLMRESGYFVDTAWIEAEEAKEHKRIAEVAEDRRTKEMNAGEKRLRYRKEFPATQLTGAMLPSVKQKKRKAG